MKLRLHPPEWTVTWPTRPDGVYTEAVRAIDPTDAVRVASLLGWPTTPGYDVAFDYTPEVWRLRHPYRWRSRHVQGPQFSADPSIAFVPLSA
jgi:hypothetical protein